MLDVDAASRDANNTFKILIATDIHLGYNERDEIRGEDSFQSFEETLQIANEQDVDLILLGGDLFHENKPSQYTLTRAVHLIRQYTFGDKDISFQVVDNFEYANGGEYVNGDATDIMKDAIQELNYCNPNLNIAYPIFSIHGNHDDPTGMSSISTLDTLGSVGLVNYIGRCDKLDRLDIKPLVLKKGVTELALYGVGHLADKRFVRLHRDGKVIFYEVNVESAFQMLMLHQNRANRGVLNYITDDMVPDFMDLVMWGHEHDCCIEPTLNHGVYYTQPGSTVATSLSEGEALPKHVGILHINQKSFHIEPIPLQSVRFLLYRHHFLDKVEDMVRSGVEETKLSEYCESDVKKLIEKMIREAKRKSDNDMLPLIRVVVHVQDERQMFPERKIGLMLDGHVANPQELVLVKRVPAIRARVDRRGRPLPNLDDDFLLDGDNTKDPMTFIRREMEQVTDMQVFTASGITETLNRFINFNDGNALDDYINYRRQKCRVKLDGINCEGTFEEIEQRVAELLHMPDKQDETNDVRKLLTDPSRVKVTERFDQDITDASFDANQDVPVPARPARGRGSRGGRGSRARAQRK